MVNRKDAKGRVLKAGESQRKDGTYMYRYVDIRGDRKTAYARTLNDLRQKEVEIEKVLLQNTEYAASTSTLVETMERYVGLKQNYSIGTISNVTDAIKFFDKFDIGHVPIGNLKSSSVKIFASQLHKLGYSYGTIHYRFSVAKSALNIAVEEDIVRKNPFNFKLSDYIPNDTTATEAYTPIEQIQLRNFFQTDYLSRRYGNMFTLLLGTGLRVSEACGLTIKDIDFDNYVIHVTHQLIYTKSSEYHVTEPKTKASKRDIPMSNEVYSALQDEIANRPELKPEPVIDGLSGFIFLTTQNNPMNGTTVLRGFTASLSRLRKIYPATTITDIRPHHLRHTFCTNLLQQGVDIKTIQYIMGHSTIDTTLRVYTHTNEAIIRNQISKIPGFDNYCAAQKTYKTG